jgi:hypothetical protein
VERVLHAEREILSESELAKVGMVFAHLLEGYADLAGGGSVVLACPQKDLQVKQAEVALSGVGHGSCSSDVDVVLGEKAVLDPLGVAAVGADNPIGVAQADKEMVTPIGGDGDAVDGHSCSKGKRERISL